MQYLVIVILRIDVSNHFWGLGIKKNPLVKENRIPEHTGTLLLFLVK